MQPLQEHTQPALLSLVPVANASKELVSDERGLLKISFFIAADAPRRGGAKRKTTRRIQYTTYRDNQKQTLTIELRGSELGLLYDGDRDKWKAFLRIVAEIKAKEGVVRNPIRFAGYYMLRLLDQSVGKLNYDAIDEWGKRMADTTITSQRVIYFAARKRYANDTIHVFTSFKRVGASAYDGSERSEFFEVELADWVLENLNIGYTYTEDFAAYKKLTRPIAKGIFDYLHVWFSASDKPYVRKDYQELCRFFEITCYPYRSQIEQKLGPSLDELKAIGYLSQWEIATQASKDGFMVVLYAGEELRRILGKSTKLLAEPKAQVLPVTPEMTPEQDEAYRALVKEGIIESKARELALRYDPYQILDLIDYVGYLVSLDRGTRKRIFSPTGLLISHIEQKVAVPLDFLTQRKQKQILAEQQRSLAEQERIGEERHRYELWKKEQARQEISARFTAEQLEARLKKIFDTQIVKQWQGARFWSPEIRRNTALGILTTEIMEDLLLPSFDEWLDQHPQKELQF